MDRLLKGRPPRTGGAITILGLAQKADVKRHVLTPPAHRPQISFVGHRLTTTLDSRGSTRAQAYVAVSRVLYVEQHAWVAVIDDRHPSWAKRLAFLL